MRAAVPLVLLALLAPLGAARRPRVPPYPLLTVEPARRVTSAVIVLHGLGQRAADNLGLAANLSAAGLRSTRFVFPEAPAAFIQDLNATAPSWFDIVRGADGQLAIADVAQVARAAARVDRLVARQAAAGVPRARVGLLGYSQGGLVAIAALLRHDIAAVAGWATALPPVAALRAPRGRGALLLLHGAADEVVPRRFARETRDLVRGLGRRVRYVEFEGERHFLAGVRGPAARITAQFLKRQFRGARRRPAVKAARAVLYGGRKMK